MHVRACACGIRAREYTRARTCMVCLAFASVEGQHFQESIREYGDRACVRVRVCVCACVRACVRTCVRACVRACEYLLIVGSTVRDNSVHSRDYRPRF